MHRSCQLKKKFSRSDAVKFVEQVLQNILDGIQVTNIGDLLAEAEQILKEIQSRDFDENKMKGEEELKKAIERM